MVSWLWPTIYLAAHYGTTKFEYQYIIGPVTNALTTINEYWLECAGPDPCTDELRVYEHYNFDDEELLEERVEDLGVLLRPNPVEDQDVELMIYSSEDQSFAIKVFNISGHVVIDDRIEVEEGVVTSYFIPNHLLANGMYFVQLQNQEGDTFVRRFVKVKE